jgi:hypothetical protein
VNTPTKTSGVGAGKAADLTYWEGAARMIASVSRSSKIIVEKSTVPVKTAEAIEKVRAPPRDGKGRRGARGGRGRPVAWTPACPPAQAGLARALSLPAF